MKIIMLGKWPGEEDYGGVATYIVNLAKHLSKFKDIKLFVVSFGKKNSIFVYENAKVIILRIWKIYYFIPILAMLRLMIEVKKIEPDIIHVNGANLSPYILTALFFIRNPDLIITYHSYPLKELLALKRIEKDSILWKLNKWVQLNIVRKSRAIISVTETIKSWIIKDFEIDEEKIMVIPNGVDILEFNDERNRCIERSEFGFNTSDYIILHAKAFLPINGQEYLIRSMVPISDSIPNARLVLVGDGPLKNELTKLAIELKVASRVSFLGWVPHSKMPRLLSLADVVVIPSISIEGFEEGSSIFLLEAMSMKKPIIAASSGGLRECLKDGENAIMLQNVDENSIAKAVIFLYNNPKFANRLATAAQEFIRKNRKWEIISTSYYKVYQNLIEIKRTMKVLKNNDNWKYIK